jgi:hypothetical protein
MPSSNSYQVPTTEQIIQTLRKTSNTPPRGPFLRLVADRLEQLELELAGWKQHTLTMARAVQWSCGGKDDGEDVVRCSFCEVDMSSEVSAPPHEPGCHFLLAKRLEREARGNQPARP